MPRLEQNLILNRCPHCKVDNPNLTINTRVNTSSFNEKNKRYWAIYICQRCGGVVTAFSFLQNGSIEDYYPRQQEVSDTLPLRAKEYLQQALNSLHAPSGAIMLAASSIDAMLKEKGYDNEKKSLYTRIEKAAEDHVITAGMKDWAHEIRMDANYQRHADKDVELPTTKDAEKTIAFTQALAQFMFEIPAKIDKGIKDAKGIEESDSLKPAKETT